MILLRKVVSLNNTERHWQIYTVCKSRVEISHRLMEISLNLMRFEDVLYKEMLTSLISFPSRNTFSLNLLFKSDFKRCLD